MFTVALQSLVALSLGVWVCSHSCSAKIINTPSGSSRINLKSIGHYYAWVYEFAHKKQQSKSDDTVLTDYIIAAVGRPTAPLFPPLRKALALYSHLLKKDEAIEYGDMQGELTYRKRMANVLSTHYQTLFHPEHILFCVGGRMGLAAISHTISTLYPGKKIVTTRPYYPPHIESTVGKHETPLVFIETMNQEGLTAEALEQALSSENPDDIGAFVFCSPNNPMGWVTRASEWKQIIPVLEQYPQALIVLDEAYAEMVFKGTNDSLITVAPHLKNQFILLRSATKGFSASGERMGIVATWNPEVMDMLRNYQSSHLIHAPKSNQFAYTYAMEHYTPLINGKELARFYETQVSYIHQSLKAVGLNYYDDKPEGTFYVVADFSPLIGHKISPQTAEIYPEHKEIIQDDVDIAFHCLAKYKLAITPLSLFGVDPKKGLLRITCSMTPNERHRFDMILQRLKKDL